MNNKNTLSLKFDALTIFYYSLFFAAMVYAIIKLKPVFELAKRSPLVLFGLVITILVFAVAITLKFLTMKTKRY